MHFEKTIILLPCHSLEDFPLHHQGDEADGLLSAWSALWHPVLLAQSGTLPAWYRADLPPEQLANRLFVVPKVSEHLLLAGWVARVKSEGGWVIRQCAHREEIVEQAIAQLDSPVAEIDAELAADFQALGYCHLQVELLTRQMRYVSNLDEMHLGREAAAGAQALLAGQLDEARQRLVNCFEVLMEARERFYPADLHLIDLTLVADTTLGPSLARELSQPSAINLLISGQNIDRMAECAPDTLVALKAAIDEQRAGLIGGEQGETELAVLGPESILRELERGRHTYERHLGRWPKVFGRRRFGLTPFLPQVLSRYGYLGALHMTLEDGQFPRGDQAKTRWQGLDSSTIDAFARLPVDAGKSGSFLGLPQKIAETMDLDQVATVVLAHWPGHSSTWYGDLRRIARYAPVLGEFVIAENYFAQGDISGRLTRFTADDYRSPYWKQAVARGQADPVSRRVEWYRINALHDAVHTLSALAAMLGGPREDSRCSLPAPDDWFGTAARAIQSQTDEPSTALRLAAARCASRLVSDAVPGNEGFLVLNPFSFTRQVMVDLPEGSLPAVAAPVLGVQPGGQSTKVVVSVPPMGFAWIGREGQRGATTRRASRSGPDNVLRNEHLEITIDKQTGGIRSVHHQAARGNLVSQQLAFRLPDTRAEPGSAWRDPDIGANYSRMVADSIERTSAGPAWTEVVSRGALLDEHGERLAGFTQTVGLATDSHVAQLTMELEPSTEPLPEPWDSYYAARFAWAEAEATLERSVALCRQKAGLRRIESPHYVDVLSSQARLSILTGGLTYHRRSGERMLDTLLIVQGESARRFRLGLGVNLKHTLPAALELLAPETPLIPASAPVRAQDGWLFTLDSQNVIATRWEPLVDNDQVIGFRVRLLENEGRGGRVQLRSFRDVAEARQIDFMGQTLCDLRVDGDAVQMEISAFEWLQIEARWVRS